jgi:Leucine-rich repeat (LRR) protein
VEFGSLRPGRIPVVREFGSVRLPHRAMELTGAGVTVVCRTEVSSVDVERFGASLSSDQRALVATFDTNHVKFTAWPELVRLFRNLSSITAFRSELVEFPLALCALPNLYTLYLPGNDFMEIPSEVSQLQQLKQFYLSMCTRLQRLPSSISTLIALSPAGP